MYVMLSGVPPFNRKNDLEILRSIMISEPLFEGKVWKQVSSGAKELITSMLTQDISARPSAQQVFYNSWLSLTVLNWYLTINFRSLHLKSFQGFPLLASCTEPH